MDSFCPLSERRSVVPRSAIPQRAASQQSLPLFYRTARFYSFVSFLSSGFPSLLRHSLIPRTRLMGLRSQCLLPASESQSTISFKRIFFIIDKDRLLFPLFKPRIQRYSGIVLISFTITSPPSIELRHGYTPTHMIIWQTGISTFPDHRLTKSTTVSLVSRVTQIPFNLPQDFF